MKKVLKMSGLTAAAALMLISTACGSNKPAESQSSTSAATPATSAAPKAPTEVTIIAPTYNDAPTNDLENIQQLNQKLNVKINASYVPSNNYDDKVNVMLASNDLPDLTVVWDITKQNWTQALGQGAFWDLTPYLKNYPNLSKIDPGVYTALSFNGKSFGVPRVRPQDGHESLIIRKDWLDKLGLQAPKTTDEFYKVMEAFTKNDPDGNGKPDTYGFAAYATPTPQTYLYSMFGSSSAGGLMQGWANNAGQLTPAFASPQMKTALTYWSKAYKDGLVVPDYPVMKAQQLKDMFIQGKIGMYIGNIYDIYNTPNVIKELQKVNPKADAVAYELPAAPDGKRYYEKSSGSFGQLMISKKVSEDKMKKILELMDYGNTLEGWKLLNYGIKDKDYTDTNLPTIAVQSDAAKKQNMLPNTSQWIPSFFNKYARAEHGEMSPEVLKYDHDLVDAISKQSILDPATGINTPTNAEKGADFLKKIYDNEINTLVGKSSLDDWDKFVKSMQEDASFQKLTKEVNDAYKARGGK
ncbi:extracellular solute-binding protein [Paenibacillus roseipurpureus]|uniref:Extracellular solute-binding protein n=1 Tax=Paenibacillus roseopurpureus TaxID=2918901 RepID=A0AA96RJ48_9BACL|nr:extracellular solute-binding protein [Paenibacillus sp. MBLB1832]WNR42771.1 extracellular solute-binding protein [Paenibacillus sp. MBLB1832]